MIPWGAAGASSLLLLAQGVLAVPYFHTVNDYYANGTHCPINDVLVQCPAACVRDQNYCPDAFKPSSCGAGSVLCGDGQCHTGTQEVCEGINNICSCYLPDQVLRPEDDVFVPCRLGQVNVSYFDQDKDIFVAQLCASQVYKVIPADSPHFMKLTSKPVAARTGDVYMLMCDPPSSAISFDSPGFIVVYVVLAIYTVLMLAWALFKHTREKEVAKVDAGRFNRNRDTGLTKTEENLPFGPAQDLSQHGYADHWFGTLNKLYMMFISLGWFIVLSLLTVDYYRFEGQHRPLFFSNQEVLSEAFIVVWHLTTLWFLVIKGFETTIANFLRLRVPITQATYVEVSRRKDHTVMLANHSNVVRFLQFCREQKEVLLGKDVVRATVPVKRTDAGVAYFVYECIHYSYSDASGEFERAVVDVGSTHEELCAHVNGLATEQAAMRQQMVGENFIPVHVPSVPVALFNEFSSAFYLYQIMMLWVWYYFAYWQVGVTLTIVIVVSGMIKVYFKQQAEHKIKAMAEHSEMCTALRNGVWQGIITSEIVPGDVVLLQSGQTVPCDGVVLSGSCVMDESMLTGESMPVQKTPVKRDPQPYAKHGSSKKHTLFAGTKVLQAQPYEGDDQVKFLAVHTGAGTDKGELIQHILYPAPIFFIFDEHLKIVVCILLAWGILSFALIVGLMDQGTVYAWFYGIFAISQIMHPMLPAVLVIGQTVSAKRLQINNIYCTNFQRIAMAGKLQVFCFDKTGTLTRDGLNFYGVHPIEDGAFKSPQLGTYNLNPDMQVAMAVAHSVTWLEECMVGNPVDVEMFRAVGWELKHGKAYDTVQGSVGEYHILRRFEFDHARACMTSVAQNAATGEVFVFSKGSFEKIKSMVDPSTLPADYDTVTGNHAKQGCYTLAFARRSLGKVDAKAVAQMERSQLETGLGVLGVIMFRNLLKDDTPDALARLKKGSVRPVMVTGDNALTAVHIARECGMFQSPRALVLLGDVSKDSADEVQWVRVDTGAVVDVDEYLARGTAHRPSDLDASNDAGQVVSSLRPFSAGNGDMKMKAVGPSDTVVEIDEGVVELAVTGKAFDALVRTGLMRRYLMRTRIFARMMPYNKVQCVQLFMELGVTGMCGDGGNDCGALRAAHVGIALSEAEASIVSPFSSKAHSIQSCVTLVSEGRAALATSFSSYKFLIMYGEILTFMSFISAYFMVQFWWWAWVFIDAFIVIPVSYALSLSRPRDTLARYRPTARLLGAQTVVSVCAMTFFNALFQFIAIAMLFGQPWFLCREFDGNRVDTSKWWTMADNYEAEVTAIMTIFQMIAVPFALNFGAKFRRAWYTNYFFVFLFTVYFVMMSVVTLAPPNALGCWFHINCGEAATLASLGYNPGAAWNIRTYYHPDHHNVMPSSFRLSLYLLCLVNTAVVWTFEYVVILGPVRTYLRKRRGPTHSIVL
eukprot:comp24227_c0_seq2/m.44655 comp24227_c0_seq2/g.44655  ORF comp24227_c0_seq2/g.44655 comp24227_c0_seq2/m.44655 type:complete len:1428 (-) comp24227_c0_seq2:591-4874(-)